MAHNLQTWQQWWATAGSLCATFKSRTSDKDGVAASPFHSNVQPNTANSLKENIILRITKPNIATQQEFWFLKWVRLYEWLVFSHTFLLWEDIISSLTVLSNLFLEAETGAMISTDTASFSGKKYFQQSTA